MWHNPFAPGPWQQLPQAFPPQYPPSPYQCPVGAPQMQPSMFPQQLPMQHIFSAPSPFQMAPVQVAAVQQLLAAEKPQVVVKQTKQQQHAAIAAALRKPEPRKDVSAKKGVAERQYTIADLQAMLREVITGAASSVKAAASIAGFPHAYRTLARYTRAIRTNPKLQRDTDEDTLRARLDFVDQLEFKQKGNEDLVSRRLFSDDELDAFARQLKAYGDMGWALDYQLIRTQFSEAAATKGAIDWKTGEAFVVSTGYVSEFVRKRPELKAYKMSHIDPLRSKKATAQVLAMCVVPRGPGPVIVLCIMIVMQGCLSHEPLFTPNLGETLAELISRPRDRPPHKLTPFSQSETAEHHDTPDFSCTRANRTHIPRPVTPLRHSARLCTPSNHPQPCARSPPAGPR